MLTASVYPRKSLTYTLMSENVENPISSRPREYLLVIIDEVPVRGIFCVVRHTEVNVTEIQLYQSLVSK